MKENYIKCYKIMEPAKDGGFQTLFHGVNGSKVIPFNTWMTAKKRWAGEGGTKYWTGFHVCLTYENIIKYLKRFTDKNKQRVIVRCRARSVTPKKSSRGLVYLAEKLYIPR